MTGALDGRIALVTGSTGGIGSEIARTLAGAGAHVIGAALERAKLAPEKVDEVFMGCVLPAGQGQAPARQAARGR